MQVVGGGLFFGRDGAGGSGQHGVRLLGDSFVYWVVDYAMVVGDEVSVANKRENCNSGP